MSTTRLKPPRLQKPVRCVAMKDGRPRISEYTHKPMTVFICPYCYTWSGRRLQIVDCCERHFTRLAEAWEKLQAAGLAQGTLQAEKPQRHLPIVTVPGAGHFVGEDGAYVLELADGRRFAKAEAVALADATADAILAAALRAALVTWPTAT